jgi:hypothetical protein
MAGVTCTECQGCGQVVKPVLVWDAIKKDYVLLDRAVQCPSCAGRGEI